MQHIYFVDIIIIVGYLLICLAIGLYKVQTIKTIRQYALGSGTFPTAVIIATIFATFTGAGSTIGIISKVYTFGITFSVAILVESLSWLTTAIVFGRNIERFQNEGCLSLGDVMESLYGSTARWITVVAAVLQSIGTMAAQISAMGYIFN